MHRGLKVISAQFVGDESARRRFVREARAAASVCHPNVASVFYLGKERRQLFLRDGVCRRRIAERGHPTLRAPGDKTGAGRALTPTSLFPDREQTDHVNVRHYERSNFRAALTNLDSTHLLNPFAENFVMRLPVAAVQTSIRLTSSSPLPASTIYDSTQTALATNRPSRLSAFWNAHTPLRSRRRSHIADV
jgi:hypothetical protein